MEENKQITKDLQEKIKILENKIKELEEKVKNHRHDGHGYLISE